MGRFARFDRVQGRDGTAALNGPEEDSPSNANIDASGLWINSTPCRAESTRVALAFGPGDSRLKSRLQPRHHGREEWRWRRRAMPRRLLRGRAGAVISNGP